MKNKWTRLSLCSFAIALAIFTFTYMLFHYLGPEGFGPVYQETPVKPFVTLLFGIWGVFFLFAAVMCVVVGTIFSNMK